MKTTKRPLRSYVVAVAAAFFLLLLTVTACKSSKDEPKAAAEECAVPAAQTPAQTPAPTPPVQVPPPGPVADEKVYDLYVMSMCPYGFTAVAELADMMKAFPQRELNVWFIGRVEGEKLSSMRGDPEVFDEKLWLGVKALYPSRYLEFLARRGTPGPKTEDLLKEMKFDAGKIRRWAEEKGHGELRDHYIRSTGRGINASPTLFIDNVRHNGRVSGGELVRARCRAVNPMPKFCADYPECSSDNDCSMPGKVGVCVNPGASGKTRAVCEFRDDVKFYLTILVADSAMGAPEMPVIQSLRHTLPGLYVNTVKLSSEGGQWVMERHKPTELPFFHLDKAVEGAHRFASVRGGLDQVSDGYILKKGSVRANYFPQRTEKPGAIEVYADPLMPNIGSVIKTLLSNPDFAKRVTLRPAAPPKDPRLAYQQALDKARSEEALRWLVLADEFPNSYLPYLERYADSLNTSYWFNWLKPIKVNQGKFLNRINANRQRMDGYWASAADIYTNEPIVVMIGNRAKLIAPNSQELERVLKAALAR